MKNKEALIALGKNTAKIGKTIGEYRLNLQDFRDYYVTLIKSYNKFIEFSLEFINPTENINDDLFDKEVIRTEIKAWEVYINFKRNNMHKSLKDILLFYRYYFLKKSDYRKKFDEIREIKSELKDPHNTLENEDKLKYLRKIGDLYEDISNERVVKNYEVFWAIVGIILMIIFFVLGKS